MHFITFYLLKALLSIENNNLALFKNAEKTLCQRKDLLDLIKNRNFDILMTLGAADINVLLEDIKEILLTK